MTEKHLDSLILQWQTDSKVRFCSSHRALDAHPAFKEFVNYGWGVVPYIFKKYEKEDNWAWCSALFKITKCNPVLEDHRGRYNYIKKDWMKWRDQNIQLINEKYDEWTHENENMV